MIGLSSRMLQCGFKAPHYSNKALLQGCLILAILLLGDQHVEGQELVCSNMDGTNHFRLFLTLADLVMDCNLVRHPGITDQHYKDILKLYASAGVLPKMEIYNSTNSYAFDFKMSQEGLTWRVIVPRNNITTKTAAAPIDQWHVEVNMFQGYDVLDAAATLLRSLTGTLLDLAREPILQWLLGEGISSYSLYPYWGLLMKIQVAQSPCAGDVAVISPIFAYHPEAVPGVILGYTNSAFLGPGTLWFNLTNTLCSFMTAAGCNGLTLIDLKLTNCHLFLLTNRGLFISQDLLSPVTGFLSFTWPNNPILNQMNYDTATIWYSGNCQTNALYFSDDYVSVVSNTGVGPNLVSRCAFSGYPFTHWYPCQGSDYDLSNPYYIPRYLAFLYDRYQQTALLLSTNEFDWQTGMVSMLNIGKTGLDSRTKVPSATIAMEGLEGMYMGGNQIFLYGNQLWVSDDRGAKFHYLLTMPQSDRIVDMVSCPYNNLVVGVSTVGTLIVLRAGLHKYSSFTISKSTPAFMYCDHIGLLMVVDVDFTTDIGFISKTIDPTIIQVTMITAFQDI
ncbi:cation channel sperm-associated auxiliary subunit beta-like [Engraulis encrasicolus]|uniref:cation channel sperm-associated auxiliary subunit beta-like n=1 Tax=Engraulis encrasicolus TaxID=184585 RepID=UPI002FD1EA42